ncbi:serine hydrolase [Colwelliaceae bacterium MEBiC 14330]
MQILSFIKLAVLVILGYSTVFSVNLAANNYNFISLVENLEKTKQLANLPSGTSIVAIKDDEIVFQAHIGFADIANDIKVTGETPFYIASVTKPFTALNALLDIENKNLSPNIVLSDMFPNFELKGINDKDIGINHLLTHTSSIDNYPLVLATAYSGEYDSESLITLVHEYSEKEPQGVGNFKYTNVGYNLYSIFADNYFESSWQERLSKQVFEPLELTHTSAARSFFDKYKITVAKPYSLMVNTLPKSLPLEKQDVTMHAAGGMYASSNDLAKFLMVQLNQGKLKDKQVFPASVVLKSQQQQVVTEAKYMDIARTGYAWGWYTGEYKGHNMLHHFGGFSGTHAHLSFMPDQKLGLAVINNEDFLSSRLTSIIADYVYGKLLQEKGIDNKVEKRFMALNKKISSIDTILEKQQLKISNRKINLSLPMHAYVGKYHHPQLGTVSITEVNDNQINVNWGVMNSIATGFDEQDKIRVTLKPTSGEIISFDVDKKILSLTYQGLKFSRI